jgi:serine/threonine-protein kinase
MIKNERRGFGTVKTLRNLACGGLFVGALCATTRADADPTPADKAASAAVFADAKALVADGHFAEACPKFAEAQRLYPTSGTLLNLGDCYERSTPPRTASAWGAFKQAEVMARNAGDTARQEEGGRRAQVLEAALSRVTIVPAPAARIPGLEVKWDGKSVGEGLWGTAFPVDAGEHALEANAPGKRSWTRKLVVQPNGGTVPLGIPELPPAPLAAAPGPAVGAPEASWSTQRYVGLGIGAVGIVGGIVGGIFGAKAAGKNSDSLPHCLPDDIKHCDPTGIALRNDAFSAAEVSTILFIASGVAVTAGTITFLAAPAGTAKIQPVVGAGFGGLTLHGTW